MATYPKGIIKLHNALTVAKTMASDGKADAETMLEFLGEAAQQIQEGWMKLPLDMDGEPIREGDTVQFVNDAGGTGAFVEVCAVSEHYVYYDYGKHSYRAASCRIVKPRTLEDVLADVARGILSEREGVDEIRELMEVEL